MRGFEDSRGNGEGFLFSDMSFVNMPEGQGERFPWSGLS